MRHFCFLFTVKNFHQYPILTNIASGKRKMKLYRIAPEQNVFGCMDSGNGTVRPFLFDRRGGIQQITRKRRAYLMKGKHAKDAVAEQKYAKRLFTLCFAVVFLCSCLLPVFASGPLLNEPPVESVETTVELEKAETDSVAEEETTDSVSTAADSTEDEPTESEAVSEEPASSIEDTIEEISTETQVDELPGEEFTEELPDEVFWEDTTGFEEVSDAAVFAADAYASRPRSTDFTFSVENAEVVYVHYDSSISATEAGNLEFESVTGPFTTDWDHNYNNYWVFFVKPDENYMVTGIGASGYDANYRNDIYSVNGSYSKISHYPGIAALVDRAKALGYVGMFGYSRNATDNTSFTSADVTVTGEQPPITVEAVSDKTENVRPDDALTFTVTITPGHTAGTSSTGYTGRDTVEDVTIESLIINGVDYKDSCTPLVANGDGTYTTTVPYTATRADCNAGLVRLDVTASVDYKVKLNTRDFDEATVDTDATIESSASVECLIAPKSQVRYVTIIEDAPASYPEELDEHPTDSTTYYEGELVKVDATYPGKTVVDAENGGIWTFDGWYLGEDKVTEAEMTQTGLVFEGVWRFTKMTSSFKVEKSVRGNMADPDREFPFSITVRDADGNPLEFQLDGVWQTGMANFTLKDGEDIPLTHVPTDAAVIITETDAEGYRVNAMLDDEYLNLNWQDDGGSFAFTVAQPSIQTLSADGEDIGLVLLSAANDGELTEGSVVTVINKKELPVPAGMAMDTAPYLLLFTLTGAGAGRLLLRKRRYED